MIVSRRPKIPPFEKLTFVDKRWPVRAVNAAWDMFGRPRLDRIFGGRLDITHSPTRRCVSGVKGDRHGLRLVLFGRAGEGRPGSPNTVSPKPDVPSGSADGVIDSEYSAGRSKRFGLDEEK